jgi:hypothetical protein
MLEALSGHAARRAVMAAVRARVPAPAVPKRPARDSRCDTPPEVFAEAPEPSGRPVAVHDVVGQVDRACRPVAASDGPSLGHSWA